MFVRLLNLHADQILGGFLSFFMFIYRYVDLVLIF